MNKVDLECKLRTERVERCLNCLNFRRCEEVIQLVEICGHYKEMPIKMQKIVVDLELYSSLQGCKDKSVNCSF